MTSARLAEELEVTRRTILRDVDALTEAGLPILAYSGAQGGIELGFNYRTRLTLLAADEAEALAVALSCPLPFLDELGLGEAGARARRKTLESLPEASRDHIAAAADRYRFDIPAAVAPDPRVAAVARAVREGLLVRLRSKSRSPLTIRPAALQLGADGWRLVVEGSGLQIPVRDWGDIDVIAASE